MAAGDSGVKELPERAAITKHREDRLASPAWKRQFWNEAEKVHFATGYSDRCAPWLGKN